MTAVVVLWGRQLGGEQGVNERGFPQTRFTCVKVSACASSQEWVTRLTDDHDGEVSAAFGNDFMFLCQVFEMKKDVMERETHLVGQVGDADTFRHCFLDDARWQRDQGRMLVEDSSSCLSLFVCLVVVPSPTREYGFSRESESGEPTSHYFETRGSD